MLGNYERSGYFEYCSFAPVERVDDIYVMTELDFNTSLLNFLSQFGINVHFFNYYGFVLSADMRCTVHISHLNSVKNHLYYYDTV